MIILLYGEDAFRLREKLNEIISNYQTKHQSGLNFTRYADNLDFDKVQQNIEAVSMFDEKKLIVIDNALDNSRFIDDFFAYAKAKKLKQSDDVVVVMTQQGKIAVSKIKTKLSMYEDFQPLQGAQLVAWLKARAKINGGQISLSALNRLIAYIGDDLWQLNNELNKLISYKAGQEISEQDVDDMVKSKTDVNIFKTLDALANRDKKTALRLIHEHLSEGENEMYLLTMLAYQIRVLIKLRDLVDRGVPYYSLAKQSKLHPYVVKKSANQIRNFSSEQLNSIFQKLLDIDIKIKTGRIDAPASVDLLVAEI